jgi:hypothetical protein
MQCKVCGSSELKVVAEAGLGQNLECTKCGSLHLSSPFGLELLQAGQPKPKAIYREPVTDKTFRVEFDTDEEAFAYVAEWNRKHGVVPGAYVIDSGGVLATDPLHPYRGG